MTSEIRCQNCGRVNPLGSNFCMACGEKLPSGQRLPSCPNCGAAHPVDGVICPTCGAGLKVAAHDERGFELRLPRLRYAGFWIRVGAYLLDGVFLVLRISLRVAPRPFHSP
ncbi:MAG: zinc ribbon domain-containing protein [Nitrospinota bacterium]